MATIFSTTGEKKPQKKSPSETLAKHMPWWGQPADIDGNIREVLADPDPKRRERMILDIRDNVPDYTEYDPAMLESTLKKMYGVGDTPESTVSPKPIAPAGDLTPPAMPRNATARTATPIRPTFSPTATARTGVSPVLSSIPSPIVSPMVSTIPSVIPNMPDLSRLGQIVPPAPQAPKPKPTKVAGPGQSLTDEQDIERYEESASMLEKFPLQGSRDYGSAQILSPMEELGEQARATQGRTQATQQAIAALRMQQQQRPDPGGLPFASRGIPQAPPNVQPIQQDASLEQGMAPLRDDLAEQADTMQKIGMARAIGLPLDQLEQLDPNEQQARLAVVAGKKIKEIDKMLAAISPKERDIVTGPEAMGATALPDEHSEDRAGLRAAREQWMEIRDYPGEIDWSGDPVQAALTFGESIGKGILSRVRDPRKQIPFGGEIIQATENLRMRRLADKVKRGKATEEEMAQFEAFQFGQDWQGQRPVNVPYAGAQVAAEIPRYAAEYAILRKMPGGGQTIEKALLKAMRLPEAAAAVSAADAFVPQTVNQWIRQSVATLASGAAMGAENVPAVAMNMTQRMVDDYATGLSPAGDVVLREIQKEGDDPLTAGAKGLAQSMVEMGTESFGEVMAGARGIKVGQKSIGELQDALKIGIIGKWLRKKGIDPTDTKAALAQLRRLQRTTGVQGVFQETVEEEVGEPLQAIIDGREYNDPLTTEEGRQRLMTEVFGIAMFGLPTQMGAIRQGAQQEKQARTMRERVEKYRRGAQRNALASIADSGLSLRTMEPLTPVAATVEPNSYNPDAPLSVTPEAREQFEEGRKRPMIVSEPVAVPQTDEEWVNVRDRAGKLGIPEAMMANISPSALVRIVNEGQVPRGIQDRIAKGQNIPPRAYREAMPTMSAAQEAKFGTTSRTAEAPTSPQVQATQEVAVDNSGEVEMQPQPQTGRMVAPGASVIAGTEYDAPTPAQAKAGNYLKPAADIELGGKRYRLRIETPRGSIRSGVDKGGKTWEIRDYPHDYGYVEGYKGADKDELDFFIGPETEIESVYVVNQKKDNGKGFDEHKVMLGFPTREDAEDGYLAAYSPDWKDKQGGEIDIVEMSPEQFNQWMESGTRGPITQQPTPQAPASQIADQARTTEDTGAAADTQPAQQLVQSPKPKSIAVPLEDINTDTKRFQQRKEAFSEESVQKLMSAVDKGEFEWRKFDDVQLWRDPKDQKLYVLAGHSRYEFLKRMREKDPTFAQGAPAQIYENISEAEAKKIAKQSNVLGTRETDIERAGYYRELRTQGKKRKEIDAEAKLYEGKNAKYVLDISHLNPKGNALQDLSALDKTAAKENVAKMQTVAQWLGQVRQEIPELSDTHENELYKWLRTGSGQAIRTSGEFIDRVEQVVRPMIESKRLRPEMEMNIQDRAIKSATRAQYDTILEEAKRSVKAAQSALETKRSELVTRKATEADMTRVLKPLDDAVTLAQRELAQIKSQRSIVDEAEAAQGSIFDMMSPDEEVAENAANLVAALTGRETRAASASESLPETMEIDGQTRSTRNSEGDQIAATAQGVRNFWRWFGDSKIVDDQGRPLVVYHGTPKKFSAFKQTTDRPGFFFSSKEKVAQTYAKKGAKKIIASYLSIADPLVIDADGSWWGNVAKAVMLADGKRTTWTVESLFGYHNGYTDKLAPHVKDKTKFSGIAIKNVMDNGTASKELSDVYIAFENTQIKSTDNSGAFDPENEDFAASFAGPRSATADVRNLATAMKRIDAGDNAESIRKETGWFVGKDGKWRYEINDSDATLGDEVGDGDMVMLREALDHPALFAAYPTLTRIPVIMEVGADQIPSATLARDESDGSFEIYVYAKSRAQARSFLLHEVQHAVQFEEGFAVGGNTEAMSAGGKLDLFNRVIDELDQNAKLAAKRGVTIREFTDKSLDAIDDREVRQAVSRIIRQRDEADLRKFIEQNKDKGKDLTPYERYRRLYGEVEARNVQTRRFMTEKQRKDHPPIETQDVRDEDVIVMFNGKIAANAPMPVNAGADTGMAASKRTPQLRPQFDIFGNAAEQSDEASDLRAKAATMPTRADLKAKQDAAWEAFADLDRREASARKTDPEGEEYKKLLAERKLAESRVDELTRQLEDGEYREAAMERADAIMREQYGRQGPSMEDLKAERDGLLKRIGESKAYIRRLGLELDAAPENRKEFTSAKIREEKQRLARLEKKAGDRLTRDLFPEEKGETMDLFDMAASRNGIVVPNIERVKFLTEKASEVEAEIVKLEADQRIDPSPERAKALQDARIRLINVYYEQQFGPSEAAADAADSKAFHGTPHVWQPEPGFPNGRPRLDKIGTGEGNAAYGWGWYSAEAEDVARGYKKGMRYGGDAVLEDGTTLPEWVANVIKSGSKEAQNVRDDFRGRIEDAKKAVKEQGPQWWLQEGNIPRLQDVLTAIDKMIGGMQTREGALYTLDIPDDVIPKLLDWDKPLSEQSEYVKKALAKAGVEIVANKYPTMKQAETLFRSERVQREAASDIGIRESLRNGWNLVKANDEQGFRRWFDEHGRTLSPTRRKDMTGRIYYESITPAADQKAASEYLASIGIPGNRYLDAGSRGQGEGTYNYVIWDQDVLDRVALLGRNGEMFGESYDMAASKRRDTQTMDMFGEEAEAKRETAAEFADRIASEAGSIETLRRKIKDRAMRYQPDAKDEVAEAVGAGITGEDLDLPFADWQKIWKAYNGGDVVKARRLAIDAKLASEDLAASKRTQPDDLPRDMVATHGLSIRNLLLSIREGGIPAPSIAVLPLDLAGQSGFGPAVLVAKAQSILPEEDYRNAVYDADAYAPRHPGIKRDPKRKAVENFVSDVSGAAKELGASYWYEGDDKMRRGYSQGLDALEDDTAKYYYLTRVKGEKIDVPMRDRYRTNEKEADTWALRDILKERIDETEYREWTDKIADELYGEPYILRGKKKTDPTLGNIVDAMMSRGAKAKEAGMTYSIGKARAAGAKKLASRAAIKKQQSRIGSRKDVEAAREEVTKVFFDLTDKFEYKYPSGWQRNDDFSKAVGMFLRGARTEARAASVLQANDFIIGENKAHLDEFIDLADMVWNAPVPYFEAKPAKPVMLRDFAGVAIPDDTPQPIIDKIEAAGLKVEKYAEGQQGEAIRRIADTAPEDIAFSKSPLPPAIAIDGVDRPTTNSEGRQIAESLEKVRNFWKWFGDSKVVDKEGRPLVMYHATSEDFDVFSRKLLGRNTLDNASDKLWGQTSRVGFWFSTKPLTPRGKGGNVMPAYLKIESPKRYMSIDNLAGDIGWRGTTGEGLKRKMTQDGYDGAVMSDEEFGGVSYVVLKNTQIKSATGNTGAFSREDPDITHSKPKGTQAQILAEEKRIAEEAIKDTPDDFKERVIEKHQMLEDGGYAAVSDEIYLRANTERPYSTVKLHELGHRFWVRYAPDALHQGILNSTANMDAIVGASTGKWIRENYDSWQYGQEMEAELFRIVAQRRAQSREVARSIAGRLLKFAPSNFRETTAAKLGDMLWGAYKMAENILDAFGSDRAKYSYAVARFVSGTTEWQRHDPDRVPWLRRMNDNVKTEALKLGYSLWNQGAMDPQNFAARFKQEIKKIDPNAVGAIAPHISRVYDAVARAMTTMNPGVTAPQNVAFAIEDESRIQKFEARIADEFSSVKRLEKAVTDAGGAIPEEAKVYRTKRLSKGVTRYRLEDADEKLIQPLITSIADAKKRGISMEEIALYLIARHAPERNVEVARRNEYADEWMDGGSGMTNEESQAIMDDYRKRNIISDIDLVARRFDAITAKERDIRRKNLEGPEAVQAWEDMFKHYVPLRTAETPDMVGRPLRKGQWKTYRTKSFAGRKSLSDNPIEWAVAQLTDAIINDERNDIRIALYNAAKEFPNPDVWEVDKTPRVRTVSKTTGLVKEVADPTYARLPNVVTATIEGVDHHIELKDPVMARQFMAIGQTFTSEDAANAIIRMLGVPTRWLTKLTTGYNPPFMLTNFVRDSGFATAQVLARHGPEQAAMFAKSLPSAVEGIWRINFPGIDAKKAAKGKQTPNDWAPYLKRFKVAGGQMGWYSTKSIADIQKDIERQVAQINEDDRGIRKLARKGRMMIDVVERANEAAELGTRLAYFKLLVDSGTSDKDAAFAAREITVDFDQKGEWGRAMNSVWAFSNAAVQGTVVFAKFMAGPTGRRIAAATFGASFAHAIAMRLAGGSDDEDGLSWYEKRTTWERESNVVLMIPGSNGAVVKFPVPHGLGWFWSMGQIAADAMYDAASGPFKAGPYMQRTLESAMSAFNPLGGGPVEQIVAPTAVEPFLQSLTNKTFTGAPVRPEPPPFREVPDHTLYFKSAPGRYTFPAKMLNDLTGGTQYEPGLIDVSPETIQLYTEFAFGGLGKTLTQVAGLPIDAISAARGDTDALDPRNVPGLGRFAGITDDEYATESRYREIMKEVKRTKDIMRDMTPKERADYVKKNKEIVIFARNTSDRALSNQISALRERMVAADNTGRYDVRDRIAKQIMTIQKRIIKRYPA